MRLLFFIAFLMPLFSSATTITGFAAQHVGDQVRVLRYEDYVTKKTIEIASSEVKLDSTFSLEFDQDETFEAILEVGNTYGYIYLQKDGNYKIGVPLDESHAKNMTHNSVRLVFMETPPKDDINYMILDFDDRIDEFFGKNVDLMGGQDWDVYLDSFKIHLTHIYKGNQNMFFLNYMSFSVANLELIGHPKLDVGVKMEMIYNAYLDQSPVFRKHAAYMKLVNNFYKNVFAGVAALHERDLMKAVVTENRDSIMRVLKHYPYYQNSELAELVMIKGFGEAYMNNTLPRTNILNMLADMTKHAHYEPHKVVAKNMIAKLTKLKRGYPAQNFSLPNVTGEQTSLSDFKGKHVYITFFEPWSTQSLADFKIMVKLKERYGKHIEMVSICTGPDSLSLKKFLRDKPDLDWTFLNAFGNNDLKEYYDITTFPLYYLVDPEGNLVQAPALSPSPKGNYDSIDRTMYSINQHYARDDHKPPGSMGRPPGHQPPR